MIKDLLLMVSFGIIVLLLSYLGVGLYTHYQLFKNERKGEDLLDKQNKEKETKVVMSTKGNVSTFNIWYRKLLELEEVIKEEYDKTGVITERHLMQRRNLKEQCKKFQSDKEIF